MLYEGMLYTRLSRGLVLQNDFLSSTIKGFWGKFLTSEAQVRRGLDFKLCGYPMAKGKHPILLGENRVLKRKELDTEEAHAMDFRC